MRRLAAALALLAALTAPPEADAAVTVQVDMSSQALSVVVDGVPRHHWTISTGRAGFDTPRGVFRPQRLARHWVSSQYGGAMPHAIFFRGGYAIHGTGELRALGRPASHGCIRLHPRNAAILYALVQAHGKRDTRIVITGTPPMRARLATPPGGARERAARRGGGEFMPVPRAWGGPARPWPAPAWDWYAPDDEFDE